MNFDDEPYVRLYVRDTKTWLRLEFEGQCVLMFLLRKLDKAGVLDGMDDLVSDVALVTRVPEAIVAIGMPRLLKWGVFQHVGDRLIMPNYIEAQNAIRTDKARQRDMREKRLAQARLVTPRDGAVTPRDETSREPTPANDSSHGVTLYSADLCSADLSESPERARPHVANDGPDPERDSSPESAPEHTEIRPIANEPVARTYTMPGPEPTESYLAAAAMAGVHPQQARDTWTWYATKGLPADGVERLEGWLVLSAKQRQETRARLPLARASPGGDPEIEWDWRQLDARLREFADRHHLGDVTRIARAWYRSGVPKGLTRAQADEAFFVHLKQLARSSARKAAGTKGACP